MKAFAKEKALGWLQSATSSRYTNSLVLFWSQMNSYDEDWEKGFFGTGLFLEDKEQSAKSAFKKIEEKKLLSTVEKTGILSKLEKPHFVENWKCWSA